MITWFQLILREKASFPQSTTGLYFHQDLCFRLGKFRGKEKQSPLSSEFLLIPSLEANTEFVEDLGGRRVTTSPVNRRWWDLLKCFVHFTWLFLICSVFCYCYTVFQFEKWSCCFYYQRRPVGVGTVCI